MGKCFNAHPATGFLMSSGRFSFLKVWIRNQFPLVLCTKKLQDWSRLATCMSRQQKSVYWKMRMSGKKEAWLRLEVRVVPWFWQVFHFHEKFHFISLSINQSISLPFVYYLEWISNIFNQKIFANRVISVHEATRSRLCSSDRLSVWHVPGYYRKEVYAHTRPYVTCLQLLKYIKKKIKILVYNEVHKEVTHVRKRRKN